MNAPAAVAPIESNRLAANQAVLRGRILEVKRTESAVYTVLTLPAPDAYSKPQVVEIRSQRMIGKPNEDLTVRVSIGGYRRSYKDSHGETQYATNIALTLADE